MTVLHGPMRQKCVEQCLDGRLRRIGIEAGSGQFAHHVGITECCQGGQGEQAFDGQGRKAGPFDCGQIPAGTLHVEGVNDFAGDIGPRGFD